MLWPGADCKTATLGCMLRMHVDVCSCAALQVYVPLVDAEGLCKRWEQVLHGAQTRGAPPHACLVLWSAYLRLRRMLFMNFRMATVQVCSSQLLIALV